MAVIVSPKLVGSTGMFLARCILRQTSAATNSVELVSGSDAQVSTTAIRFYPYAGTDKGESPVEPNGGP
jgi:hypothetical protein